MPLIKARSSADANILELPFTEFASPKSLRRASLSQDLEAFREFGEATRKIVTHFSAADGSAGQMPTFVNEFWTARQRQASSLHEVSYRACFKPQLPRFFIERLTGPKDVVYDPFMGRGTTPVEAALLGRTPVGNDANPLSIIMTRPRFRPPGLAEVAERLQAIPLDDAADMPEDLLVFYHPQTLQGISSLKKYLLTRTAAQTRDSLDDWIALVALNRLTGHSNGFFSVYTLPPNQAVSVKSQRKINEKRKQSPPVRDVAKIILKKSKQLLGDVDDRVRATLAGVSEKALLLTGPANRTPQIKSNSVALVVTSPPFLNIVQYATDNWLRCWFLGIDAGTVKLTVPHKLQEWQASMLEVFR